MTLLPAAVGLFVSPAATALVYADAARRGLSGRQRTVCSVAVGLVSFAGFGTASLVDTGLISAYYGLQDQPTVAVTPLDLLLSLLLFGFVVTSLAVLGYGVASRVGPLASS